MNPATIAIIFELVEELVKLEPAVAKELNTLLSSPDTTPAMWEAKRAEIAGRSYAALVPNSGLPKT